MTEQHEPIQWRVKSRVDRWSEADVARVQEILGAAPTGDQLLEHGCLPESTDEWDDNVLTTVGLARITSLITGAGGQALTATATRLGVGDSGTAAAATDVDLQAATNRLFHTLDPGYPTTNNGVMTFRATFVQAEANWQWLEWGLDVGAPTVTNGTTVNAPLINRRVPPGGMGTKVNTAQWTLTVTVTLS